MDYLYHYQVKGAKHGVRRYQNEDGSLTPLGREHYGIGAARPKQSALSKWVSNRKKAAEDKAKQKAAKSATPPEKKVSDMSDEDLKKAIERLKLENNYKQLMNEVAPKKPSALKEFADLGKDIVKTSLKDAMSERLTDAIKSALGIKNANKVKNDQAYKYWKEKGFAPQYAPDSVKNPFSKAATDELNRSEKVKAQQKDHSFNTQNADNKYWENWNSKNDGKAVNTVVDAKRNADRAREEASRANDAATRAREAWEKAKTNSSQEGVAQLKTKYERAAESAKEAEKLASSASKKYEDARWDLTDNQRTLLKKRLG